MFNRRMGVSTFIVVLLLMSLAVSAGLLINAGLSGYLGKLPDLNQRGSMFLESVSITSDHDGCLNLYVKNTGKIMLQPQVIYIDGIQSKIDCPPPNSGETGLITWSYPGFEQGGSYSVKLFFTDNTQLSFCVTA